mmetsp:Transcript_39353/g.130287  ORF Transcript_39353/g.130287 Transcript_39353/m.130287 type:complete len:237 (-) Transcript_39353:68-778(-)
MIGPGATLVCARTAGRRVCLDHRLHVRRRRRLGRRRGARGVGAARLVEARRPRGRLLLQPVQPVREPALERGERGERRDGSRGVIVLLLRFGRRLAAAQRLELRRVRGMVRGMVRGRRAAREGRGGVRELGAALTVVRHVRACLLLPLQRSVHGAAPAPPRARGELLVALAGPAAPRQAQAPPPRRASPEAARRDPSSSQPVAEPPGGGESLASREQPQDQPEAPPTTQPRGGRAH